jgi:5'-3' exonuclease
VIVHLVDGTYELFRLYYGQQRFSRGDDKPFGAAVGVCNAVLQMFESGATHLGVATDHVVESFRNALWAGYKTSEGIDPALFAQFHPLEEALASMGVVVWPMVEFEADDALASAAAQAARDRRVKQVQIWSPDKDLAQCVRGDRVVQVDRKSGLVRNAEGVVEKFKVDAERIPDYLALVGDSADGYPGVPKIGAVTAAKLIAAHGALENFPADVLGTHRANALLFKTLATLRTDAAVFTNVDELRWRGPTKGFAALAKRFGDERVAVRAERVAASLG